MPRMRQPTLVMDQASRPWLLTAVTAAARLARSAAKAFARVNGLRALLGRRRQLGYGSDASGIARKYGPWAVITGASEGIGQAFARLLASQGLHVVLVARRAQPLAALASELTQIHGVQCQVLTLDLSDLGAVDRLVVATGNLDVGLLVAAAGYGTSGPFLDADLGTEIEMMDLNCMAVATLAWHAGSRMVKRGRGGVVLLSSVMAFQGTAYAANYAATKAYIQTLAEGLHVEWAAHGVDVIASAPGPIRSGFAKRANLQMAFALQPEVVARVTMKSLGRRTTVRPGWLSKMLGWSLGMLPRRVRVIVMTQVMKDMTAHQDRSA